MAYHRQCVPRGNTHAWIIDDLPFGSYFSSFDHAMESAMHLMQSGA
jgi:3-methyl-2-oxobutanoate hydroxymethyltransferase